MPLWCLQCFLKYNLISDDISFWGNLSSLGKISLFNPCQKHLVMIFPVLKLCFLIVMIQHRYQNYFCSLIFPYHALDAHFLFHEVQEGKIRIATGFLVFKRPRHVQFLLKYLYLWPKNTMIIIKTWPAKKHWKPS